MAATTGPSIRSIEDQQRRIRLANLTKLIAVDLDVLNKSFLHAKREIDITIPEIIRAYKKFLQLLQQGEGEMMELDVERELRELKQETSKLKLLIPFNLIDGKYPRFRSHLQQGDGEMMGLEVERELWELKKETGKFKHGIPFNLIDYKYEQIPNLTWRNRVDLDDDEHPTSEDLRSFLDNNCLLSDSLFLRIFLLFPEKVILKLSLLACWEDVHGLGARGNRPELHVLVSKGIIKPVYKTCSRAVSGFWMHPFVRSTLSAAFLKTEWRKHYIVNSSEDEEEDVFYFNSLEYSEMKHLKFLHLGTWHKSSPQKIEMEEPGFYFENLQRKKNIFDLRYISFRGIFMIKELPKVLKKVVNLNFLDLRACFHIQAIPSDIGYIWKGLKHLDMSECYSLDYMPASLSRLHHLCVLKGFYVGETSNNKKSCALQDLSSLTRLRKLHIHTTVKGFPNADQLTALNGFVSLRRLTISWGGFSARSEEFESTSPNLIPLKEFSFQLEKLDLQCVPDMVTRWLKPSNFQMLKKLYIRGGEINDLGGGVQKDRKGKGLEEEEEVASKDNSWSVEILRLKHLSELQIDWSKLVHLFPDLVSLEKVDCPNLTGFPCDESGLWMKTTQQPPSIPIPTYTQWYADRL